VEWILTQPQEIQELLVHYALAQLTQKPQKKLYAVNAVTAIKISFTLLTNMT